MKDNKNEWYPVIGFENQYLISFDNRVMSIERKCLSKNGKLRIVPGKLLSVKKSQYGYLRAALCINGRAKLFSLHSIIAKMFVPNDNLIIKNTVNHKDGDKLNNHPSNLELCSRSENNYHAYATGLKNSTGEMNGRAKITKQIAENIKAEIIPYQLTRRMIAQKYGVSKSTVDKVLSGEVWA